MATIQQLISPSILRTANRLKKLTIELQTLLPPTFIGHCQISSATAEQLAIATDSPVWSNQLRYYLPVIRKHFRHHNIRIFVAPISSPSIERQQRRVTPRNLNANTANTLTSAAHTITDKKLKQALLKLANTKAK